MRIVIFASREKTPDTLSKMIMHRLDTDYSHVGMIIGDTIHHAVGEGVCTVPMDEFTKKREFATLIDVTHKVNKTLGEIEAWLEGRKGTEYSSSQYLAFAFPELARWVQNGSEKVVCSEFAYEFAVFTGLLKKDHFLNPDLVDPKMIIEALK